VQTAHFTNVSANKFNLAAIVNEVSLPVLLAVLVVVVEAGPGSSQAEPVAWRICWLY
jgi:hypothetical protein